MDESSIFDWIFGSSTDAQAIGLTGEEINALADSYATSHPMFDPTAVRWLDTDTGQIVTASEASALDQAAFSASVAAAGGSTAGVDVPAGTFVNSLFVDPATGKVVGSDGNPPAPGLLDTLLKNITPGTPIGNALVTLLLGGAGVGLAAALTPGAQKLTLPTTPMNPVQEAGQKALLDTIFKGQDPVAAIRQAVLTGQMDPASAANALKLLGVTDPEALVKSFQAGGGLTGSAALTAAIGANLSGQAETSEALRQQAERARVAATQQAPIQDLIRSIALSQVPGAVATPEPTDLVGAGIRDRVLKALRGGVVDPGLERTLAEQKDILLNNLAKMYGRPGQETEGTVGGALVQGFDEKANELRYNVNRDILNTLAPQEAARTAYTAGRGDIRLGQDVTLSQLGLTPPAATAGSLSSTMPIQPLLGINDTSGQQTAAMQAQAAIAAYNAQNASDQSKAAAVAKIFGASAGALTAPTYNFTMANPAANPFA